MSKCVGFFPLEKMPTLVNFRHNSLGMTAIVSIYTSEGFIIGADGLRKSTNGTVVTQTARKLFPFESAGIRLVYAWSGTTQVLDSSNQSVFDFRAVSEIILKSVALLGANNFTTFIEMFRKLLYITLQQSWLTNKGTVTGIFSNSEIARVLIVGYFNGVPCLAEVNVCHQDLVLLEPSVGKLMVPAQPGCYIFSGSKIVCKTFPKCDAQSSSEAVDFIRGYIQSCADSGEPDCDNIGGHIHIGKITPGEFSWIDPPV